MFSSNGAHHTFFFARADISSIQGSDIPQHGLLDLPNDILLSIAQYLDYHWNINAFSQANRSLYLLLNDYVYQFCREHYSRSLVSGLEWAVEQGSESLSCKMLDAGADALRYIPTSSLTAMTRAV